MYPLSHIVALIRVHCFCCEHLHYFVAQTYSLLHVFAHMFIITYCIHVHCRILLYTWSFSHICDWMTMCIYRTCDIPITLLCMIVLIKMITDTFQKNASCTFTSIIGRCANHQWHSQDSVYTMPKSERNLRCRTRMIKICSETLW